MDVITFPENLLTTSGLSILIHSVISLPEATSCDKCIYFLPKHCKTRHTVKHLHLASIFFGAIGGKHQLLKYETGKFSFDFSYKISIKWANTLRLLVTISSKLIF